MQRPARLLSSSFMLSPVVQIMVNDRFRIRSLWVKGIVWGFRLSCIISGCPKMTVPFIYRLKGLKSAAKG
ncbi:hypothetical protein MUK42_35764, partial [Musa troglodytarum]